MKRWMLALCLVPMIAVADTGEWKTTQVSPHEITIGPSGKKVHGHHIEVFVGKEFMVECFVSDREGAGTCGHEKVQILWKSNKLENWINPSTDEALPQWER